MSSSGQNAEEANELMATMKAEHVPMKTWYNNPAHTSNLTSLKTKYGDSFPTFWQDLIKWEGWKDVRREYLLFTENGNKFNETKSGGGGSRKRRKRWGVSSADNDDGNPNPRGRSRFANAPPTAPAPAPQADPVMAALGLSAPIPSNTNSVNTGGGGPLPGMAGLASNVPEKNREELASLQARLRKANSRLQNIDVEAARVDALPRDHPDRSPSPPPIYDQYGTRKNTRANRWREKYTEERTVCLESIMELIPSMRPPGFISKRKRSRKIHIPVEEYPTYNFIGLIIGPRGKTQKDMENKTGCKIAIRGKGSVKEGAKGRRNGQPMEGDDEPLHVLITGDDPTNIDAAAQMITDMLVVIDDEKNVHKQNQLRELALLNGTLKDEDWCNVCGEKGHKDFECPKRFTLGGRSKIQVKCAICGDTSHPTRDCAQQSKVVVSGEEGAKAKLELDEDYSAFMAELDGKPVGGTKGPGEGGQGGGGVVDESDPVAKAAAMPPSLDGQSFCTVLQPARVVDKNGGDGENTTFESDAVAKAAAAAAAQPSTAGAGNPWVSTISAVTTISAVKTVGQGSENNALPVAADNSAAKEVEVPGVTTISSATEVPGVTTISSSQVPTGVTNISGVTTISSMAPVAATSTAEAPSTSNAAPVPPQVNVTSLPPPPPSGLPPVPAGLPPPPPGPPPTQPFPGQPNPYQYQQPPPPPMGYPGQQQPPPPRQPPPPTYPPQQQQWGAPPPQQQQQQQQGWNPNSYYNYGGGDATGGAGGFNWWDQSSE